MVIILDERNRWELCELCDMRAMCEASLSTSGQGQVSRGQSSFSQTALRGGAGGRARRPSVEPCTAHGRGAQDPPHTPSCHCGRDEKRSAHPTPAAAAACSEPRFVSLLCIGMLQSPAPNFFFHSGRGARYSKIRQTRDPWQRPRRAQSHPQPSRELARPATRQEQGEDPRAAGPREARTRTYFWRHEP